ncbi:hypothetical protein NH340_JMT06090 [Sarcoptes scabiei]|nr:hypothetical protein NH340_JMT06090 [Sarcoptes scabiei]
MSESKKSTNFVEKPIEKPANRRIDARIDSFKIEKLINRSLGCWNTIDQIDREKVKTKESETEEKYHQRESSITMHHDKSAGIIPTHTSDAYQDVQCSNIFELI